MLETGVRIRRAWIVVIAGVFAGTLHAGGLAGLARAGRWDRVLEIARLRQAQLPLSASESLIAAQAAAVTGHPDAERSYLEHALGDPDTGDIAAVMLAPLIVNQHPAHSFDLMFPVLRRAPCPELRIAAADIIRTSILRGLDHRRRRRLEHLVRRLPPSLGWEATEALAETEGRWGRRKFLAGLKRAPGNRVTLRAVTALRRIGVRSAFERWLIARVFFRHGEYAQAARWLDSLTQRTIRGVSAWRIFFLRGRCAFRSSDFAGAAAWYTRAVSTASGRSQKADLLVHLARARELEGHRAGALKAALAAVRASGNDTHRLFLLRLELRLDRFDAATRLWRTIRSRRAKDRGRILVAIADRRRGRPGEALALLHNVRSRSWRAPALTAAADIELEQGHPERAIASLLSTETAGLDPFWRDVARGVMARLPASLVSRWRAFEGRALARARSASQAAALVRRWACLDPSPRVRAQLLSKVPSTREAGSTPPFRWRGQVAQALWRLGLSGLAVRWDPGGFPASSFTAAAWSAEQMLIHGRADWAIRYGTFAARRRGVSTPGCLLPASVRMAIDPLPLGRAVRSAAAAARLSPSLLAGLVREESHWKARAFSQVGACGLTQLMPATSRSIARAAGLTPPAPQELFDPAVSLRLGARELARLLEAFGGQLAPAVAAYNAGEAQAKLWLDTCGTPCSDAWYVLTIDFAATRTYTAAVLAAAHRYAALYPSLESTPPPGRTTPAASRGASLRPTQGASPQRHRPASEHARYHTVGMIPGRTSAARAHHE